MGVKEVTEKILTEANSQAEAIKADADNKVKHLKDRAVEELSDFEKETASLETKAFDSARSTVLAAARMDIAKQNLQTRRDYIDEVFVKAAEAVKNMQDSEYANLMEKLVISAVITGDEEIVTDAGDTRLGADFLKAVNSKLGEKGNLTIAADKADIGAGFILRRGKVRTNASIEVLLGQAREKLETELANELFLK